MNPIQEIFHATGLEEIYRSTRKYLKRGEIGLAVAFTRSISSLGYLLRSDVDQLDSLEDPLPAFSRFLTLSLKNLAHFRKYFGSSHIQS